MNLFLNKRRMTNQVVDISKPANGFANRPHAAGNATIARRDLRRERRANRAI